MAEKKAYTGGCHCGAVRYEVTTALDQMIACNCSICQKTGTLLAFVQASEFKLIAGEDHLVDYQFNKEVIHHLFCRVCGIRSFARGTMPDGSETVAINVRCLEGVDLASLKTVAFDGKSL